MYMPIIEFSILETYDFPPTSEYSAPLSCVNNADSRPLYIRGGIHTNYSGSTDPYGF